MMKIVCLLFAVFAVVVADVRPVPSSAMPVQHHPRDQPQQMHVVRSDQPSESTNSDMLTPDVSGDMDKAETFGFGYHKQFYYAPRYYGGYYGGYYPYQSYGYGYGYPHYY